MAKKKKTNHDAEGIIFIALGVLAFLSLVSFTFQEPKLNWLGYVGYAIGLGAEYLFGLAAYLIPFYCLWVGVKLLQGQKKIHLSYDPIYFLIFLCSSALLLTAIADSLPEQAKGWEGRVISETHLVRTSYLKTVVRYNLGGIPFYYLYSDLPALNLKSILRPTGTILIFTSLALVSFLLLTRVRLIANLRIFWRTISLLIQGLKKSIAFIKTRIETTKPEKGYSGLASSGLKINLPEEKKTEPKKAIAQLLKTPERIVKTQSSAPMIAPTIAPAPQKKNEIPAPVVKNLMVRADTSFQLPSPDLLSNPAQRVDQPTLKKDLTRQASVLEDTLKSFGIEAKVGEINSGPTITSFEVHPSIGVKVQKIKALENDIALNMQAKSIRIVAPIPGKAAVGVEVPAIHPQEVNFKEMLFHYQQKTRKMQIPILLGKAVNGDWVFADMTRMPHMLIAGATGSGKSVCINTIVMSILMNARPDEVKLLMVDPKKVELTQYSKLPHMLAPVITEPHGAYSALQWLVKEMQVRYEILKQLGLRNISSFNNRKVNKELESSLSLPIPEQMPYIVAIVDEFADLMMVSSADLETPIARIAQMARAVGIHLILATQRPSREVITGIIKANIPTRISFKVASRINSQIILDETGAESLLGNGDLLFLPPGSSQLVRAQGAYISDEDINRTIQYLTKDTEPNYLISSFDTYRSVDLDADDDSSPKGKDALYDQALTIVLHSRSASTTFLQRKLKIGYARAASLMDELEGNGVIGPQEGAKPRRVLAAMPGGENEPLGEEDETESDEELS